MNYKLTIIIPVFNNCNFTKACLEDLMKLPTDHNIIVVDNASTDKTREICKEFRHESKSRPGFEYQPLIKNFGFGYACNHGYFCANNYGNSTENVLFLNNDIRVKSDHETWTQILMNREGLVSGNGGLLDKDFNFIRETNNYIDDPGFYLSGWCLAGKTETFNRLIMNYPNPNWPETGEEFVASSGPWNKAFENYFEDPDLSKRAKQLNISLEVVNIPVHHFGHMTSKKMNLPQMYKNSQAIFRRIWK